MIDRRKLADIAATIRGLNEETAANMQGMAELIERMDARRRKQGWMKTDVEIRRLPYGGTSIDTTWRLVKKP